MLVLDPGTDKIGPKIWAVSSPGVLINHQDFASCKATLKTRGGLPKGWRIINNSTLAHHLLDELAAVQP